MVDISWSSSKNSMAHVYLLVKSISKPKPFNKKKAFPFRIKIQQQKTGWKINVMVKRYYPERARTNASKR